MKTIKCKVCDTPTRCSEDAKKVTCSNCVNIIISNMNNNGGKDYVRVS